MFSLWFNRSKEAKYAEITYGSSNDDRCGKFSYAPLLFGSYTIEEEQRVFVNVTYPGWNVTLNSVSFGNYSFSLPEGYIAAEAGISLPFRFPHRKLPTFRYGFNLTVSLNRNTAFIVGSKRVLNGLRSTLHFYYDGSFKCATVPPTFILTLNGNTVELPGSILTKRQAGSQFCTLNAIYGQGDTWGFGIDFLREYCVSVDYGKSQLGLAKNLCH